MSSLSAGFGLGNRISVSNGLSVSAQAVSDPVAHWDFAETAAPYADRTSVYRLAIAPGAGVPLRKADGFRPGVASLVFDGTDQHLQIPAAEVGTLQMGGRSHGVTVGAWVKRAGDTNSAIAGIWQEDDAAPARQYALFLNLAKYGGDDRVCGHVSRYDGPTAGYPYSRDYAWNARRLEPSGDEDWRFAVFTYDGQEIRSYLDGAFEQTPSYLDEEGIVLFANPYHYADGLNPRPADFTVGGVRLTGGFGNFLHGEIAQLRVWDRALGQAEIMALFKAERPAQQPLFKDTFRTTAKASSRAMGWRSFMGATCQETTDLSPADVAPDLFNFAGSAAGDGGYLARTASASGPGLCFFDGFENAPLRVDEIGSFDWTMNNATPLEFVRLAVRLRGQWYVSAQTAACASSHSATNWSGAEQFSVPMARDAGAWRLLTVQPGQMLSLRDVLSDEIVEDTVDAFGFFCDQGFDDTIRIGSLVITPA